MVVDVENLFMSVHKEEDTDTKQVYFYLFKVSKCVSYIGVTGKTDKPLNASPFVFVFLFFSTVKFHHLTINIVLFFHPISLSC